MQAVVAEIIKQIPDWKDVDNIQVKSLAGLTNTNYLVTVNGERFVLRVSGHEHWHVWVSIVIMKSKSCQQYLMRVSGHRSNYYLLPEGHLVTRYINGHHLSLEEYRTH